MMFLALPLFAQSPAPGDWPRYGRDLTSTRFSPLTQITTGNVARLTTAWTYRLRSDAELARGGRGGGIGG
jgi:quinoprotein glucose dehydrogenase